MIETSAELAPHRPGQLQYEGNTPNWTTMAAAGRLSSAQEDRELSEPDDIPGRRTMCAHQHDSTFIYPPRSDVRPSGETQDAQTADTTAVSPGTSGVLDPKAALPASSVAEASIAEVAQQQPTLLAMAPISMAYQVLEQCPFRCPICHARPGHETRRLYTPKIANRFRSLSEQNVRRITISGGEPMLLRKRNRLLEIIKHAHEQHIHVCLNTTGILMDDKYLSILDNYVDHLLLSFRGVDRKSYNREFGVTEELEKLYRPYDTALRIIEAVKHTGIRLEISTVVHALNIHETIDMGWKLLSINPNITWRVEEYYAIGDLPDRDLYELSKAQYDDLFSKITETFTGKFRKIRHSSKEGRLHAKDLMMTPAGNLVTTCNNEYKVVGNVDSNFELPKSMRRSWTDYIKLCRDWGWEYTPN